MHCRYSLAAHFRVSTRSTLFLHGVCMLREYTYGECAYENPRRTLTLIHTITAYSVSGNVVGYVCAYSSVQLDKSRVEKEFTFHQQLLLSCTQQQRIRDCKRQDMRLNTFSSENQSGLSILPA